jgi:bifunctional non-homologous end joining protein LigD
MALEEYKRKRDFKKTPEPEGKVHATGERERFFCVQKHLASHLHYDFRLEHNGVLLSWAVPKGPSLDPKTKRLAMKVEDHPFDYGEFEGVIPEGYGAGIVMLWDKGTWTPEVADVDTALKKGDLKFTLNGYKLKGSWVLVRTGGRYPGARGDGNRSWLLIKHRDEWSGDVDITEFAPKSVKSGGDFEDILGGDTPAIWLSNRPAKGGDAGAMLAAIIDKVARLKGESAKNTKDTDDSKDTKTKRGGSATTEPSRSKKSPRIAAASGQASRDRRESASSQRERSARARAAGGGAPAAAKNVGPRAQSKKR